MITAAVLGVQPRKSDTFDLDFRRPIAKQKRNCFAPQPSGAQACLTLGLAGFATPGFLLQLVDFFRSVRLDPILIEFSAGFPAEGLEI